MLQEPIELGNERFIAPCCQIRPLELLNWRHQRLWNEPPTEMTKYPRVRPDRADRTGATPPPFAVSS